MKILSDKEQLEEKIKQVWNDYQITVHEVTKLRQRLSSIEERWLVRESRKRLLRFEIEQTQRIADTLYEYQASLRERLTSLTK